MRFALRALILRRTYKLIKEGSEFQTILEHAHTKSHQKPATDCTSSIPAILQPHCSVRRSHQVSKLWTTHHLSMCHKVSTLLLAPKPIWRKEGSTTKSQSILSISKEEVLRMKTSFECNKWYS